MPMFLAPIAAAAAPPVVAAGHGVAYYITTSVGGASLIGLAYQGYQ